MLEEKLHQHVQAHKIVYIEGYTIWYYIEVFDEYKIIFIENWNFEE